MERTVLITGATRGIGRDLAVEMSNRGFRVFATGRDERLLETLCRTIPCVAVVCDLADPEAVERLYAKAQDALGGSVDVLVNNAGFNSRKAPIAESSLDEFEAQYAVNLRAPYILCREALREMSARRSGHIVNILSTCVKFANETMGVYTAMKHGLHGLTAVLVKEARQFNVKVTAVYPGGTDTQFRAQARPDYLRPESAARLVADAIDAPDDAVVHDLTFRPMVESNF